MRFVRWLGGSTEWPYITKHEEDLCLPHYEEWRQHVPMLNRLDEQPSAPDATCGQCEQEPEI